MKKQQSPVEFYREQLNALVSMRESKFKTEREIFEQAKQMEQDKLYEAYNEGGRDAEEALFNLLK